MVRSVLAGLGLVGIAFALLIVSVVGFMLIVALVLWLVVPR